MAISSTDRIKNGFDAVITTNAPFKGLPIFVPPNLYSSKLKAENGGRDYKEVMLSTISKPITNKPSPIVEALQRENKEVTTYYPIFAFRLNNPDGSTKTITMSSKDLNKARAEIELESFKAIAQPTVAQKERIYELKVYCHTNKYSRPGIDSLAREVITDELARGNLVMRADGKIVGKEYEFRDPLPQPLPNRRITTN